jgi:hypothetical protein
MHRNVLSLLLAFGRAQEASKIVVQDGPPAEQFKYFRKLSESTHGFRPDYSPIKAPALAFFMVPAEHFAVTPETEEASRKRMNAWWQQQAMPYVRGQIDKFKREMQRGRVVELDTKDHFIFQGAFKDQVLAATRAFLLDPNLR